MKQFYERYIKPFWFTTKSEAINPPYFYGFCLQVALYASIIIFFRMAVNRYDAGVLAVTAGVIGTLSGLYVAVLRLFDVGRKEKMNGNGRAKVDIEGEDE